MAASASLAALRDKHKGKLLFLLLELGRWNASSLGSGFGVPFPLARLLKKAVPLAKALTSEAKDLMAKFLTGATLVAPSLTLLLLAMHLLLIASCYY